MGSFDDMVSKFPTDGAHKDGYYKFSSILCEQLLFSGPMVINDGYLVQQPDFLELCETRPAYLDAAIKSGMLKILSRGKSLNEVIENSHKTGVISHQLIKDKKYRKYKDKIDRLSKYLYDNNAVLPFPRKDLTAGYLKLSEKVANLLEEEGCAYPNRDAILPIVIKSIDKIKTEGKAARTQWENVSEQHLNHPLRSSKAREDPVHRSSMHLANEIYHHNMSLLISGDSKSPIFCDTNRSGLFDDCLDKGYSSNRDFLNSFIPYINKKYLLKNSDGLAGIFDEDNSLYSIKRDYLKELYLYMTNQREDERSLVQTKEIYQSALGIKLGYNDNVSQYFHRINIPYVFTMGVVAALIGAVVTPQIGTSMIMATLALTAATYAGGNYIVPRGLSLFFKREIDKGRAFGLRNFTRRYYRNANFMNLPISLSYSKQFSSAILEFNA